MKSFNLFAVQNKHRRVKQKVFNVIKDASNKTPTALNTDGLLLEPKKRNAPTSGMIELRVTSFDIIHVWSTQIN